MPALRELIVLLLVVVAGAALAPAAWSGRRRAAAAAPIGVAAVTVVELMLLATRLPVAYPVVALALAVVLGGVVALRTGSLGGFGRPWGPALVAVVVGIVAVTAWLPLVNVSADSFRYLTTAGLLVADGSVLGASGFLLLSRSLAVAAVHGLADPALGYLRAVGPLVALGTVALVGDVVLEGLRRLDASVGRLVAVGAMLLLATNHWFVFHALYVNGHLLFAAWLLLLAVVSLDVVRSPDAPHGQSLLLTSLLAVAVVVLRPEGTLVAGLALAPVVLESAVPRRWRGVVLASTGAGVVLWHAAVVLPAFEADAPDLRNVLAMTAVGVGLLVAPALLPLVDRFRGARLLHVLHVGAWVVVLLGTLRAPRILGYSAVAALRNVTSDGLWGVSLWVLAGLVVWVLWTRRVPEQRVWVFPLLTFVPLSLALAFLRGGAYRIGPGDSLNRMLVHVLPLAVLTVALAAAGEARAARADAEGS